MDHIKSEILFIPLLEFNAPRYIDFTTETNLNFQEIDEWFLVDHSREKLNDDSSIHQKITFSNTSKNLSEESRSKEEESRLEELIKLHNEKIRKRKSCTMENSQFLKFDMIKRKKYSEINREKVMNNSVSNFSSTTNHTNNLLNFDGLMKNHLNKETFDKYKISKKINKRINENVTVNNNSFLHKSYSNLTPTVKKDFNEKTRDNKFKIDNKSHAYSSSIKQTNKNCNGSNKLKSNNLRNISVQNNKPKSVTYCPRIYDAKTLKKWELFSKKDFYKLSPNSRCEANKEIADMIKNNKL